MTGQVSIKQKTLAASLIIMATILISIMSVVASGEDTNAEMTMTHRSNFGNMNTSLSQAMITAEKSVGNSSFAIAGFGINGGGHLAYTIIIGTHGPESYNVTVHPTNGHVLATEELTKQELEKAHLEHSQKVLTEPHLMNNTFVH
jgi:hypothetical protein